MWPTSEEYRATLASGLATLRGRADVLEDGVVVHPGLQVLAGGVVVDEANAVRRRCDLVVADPAGLLAPVGGESLLAPYGRELALYQGLRLSSGAFEDIPAGVFRFESVELEPGIVALAGFDRSYAVALAGLERPRWIRGGTNVGTAAMDLIASRSPLTEFRFATTDEVTTDMVLDEEADPWEEATALFESAGMEVFFDPVGLCVARPVPEPTAEAVEANYFDGAGGALVRLTKRFSTDPGHNVVIVTGESTSNRRPVRGVAEDLDPTSPTYVRGRYGRRPRFVRSEKVQTTRQARAMARGLLQRESGGTEVVALEVLPNAAHEAGDVVRARRSGIGVDDLCVVSSFTVNLGHRGAMAIDTRRRRTLEEPAA